MPQVDRVQEELFRAPLAHAHAHGGDVMRRSELTMGLRRGVECEDYGVAVCHCVLLERKRVQQGVPRRVSQVRGSLV